MESEDVDWIHRALIMANGRAIWKQASLIQAGFFFWLLNVDRAPLGEHKLLKVVFF